MAFTIDCGTDMYGAKVNVEMKFAQGVPSLQELVSAVETEFDVRARANRPAGYPDTPWKCETLQVFDDSVSRWVDLYDTRQLKMKGQLWSFQPESIWHSDAQGVIPEAQKTACTFTTPMGSPARARVAADAGVPPTLSEKLRSVFYQIDGQNKKYILFEDLERAFRQCSMEFTYSTAGDLFQMADSNRSGHITYDEFVNFSIKAPQVIDALFFRFRDMQNAAPAFSPQQSAMPMQSVPMQSAPQPVVQPDYARQQLAEEEHRRREAEARAAEEQAQRAAQQAQALQQQAAQAAAEAQAAAQRHQQSTDDARRAADEAALANQQVQQAQQQAMSQPQPSYQQPMQSMGAASPDRDAALREYEAARRRADEIRMAKEEAEREERNAWDRCYYSGASPSRQY